MLDLGIGKVASRYWQLEGRTNQSSNGIHGLSSRGGVDPLELATAQLLAEQEAAKYVAAHPAVEELEEVLEEVTEKTFSPEVTSNGLTSTGLIIRIVSVLLLPHLVLLAYVSRMAEILVA